LLGVLNGNNAGCRQLPRQIISGLAVPNSADVPGLRRPTSLRDFHHAWVCPRHMTIIFGLGLKIANAEGKKRDVSVSLEFLRLAQLCSARAKSRQASGITWSGGSIDRR